MRARVWLFAVLFGAAGGCGDDGGSGDGTTSTTSTTGTTETSTGTTETGDEESSEESTGGKICIEDTVIEVRGLLLYADTLEFAPGVEVCVDDCSDIACGLSNDQGLYDIDAPTGIQTQLKIGGTNFPTMLLHVETGQDDITSSYGYLTTEVQYGIAASAAGVEIDPTKGIVAVRALNAMTQTATGVSGTLTPASGSGPYYFDDFDNLDPGLTEGGRIVWFNVDPGMVEVELSHASLTCTFGANTWPGSGPSAGALEVVADHVSANWSVSTRCE